MDFSDFGIARGKRQAPAARMSGAVADVMRKSSGRADKRVNIKSARLNPATFLENADARIAIAAFRVSRDVSTPDHNDLERFLS